MKEYKYIRGFDSYDEAREKKENLLTEGIEDVKIVRRRSEFDVKFFKKPEKEDESVKPKRSGKKNSRKRRKILHGSGKKA